MSDVDKEGKLTINKETVDILVANIIPTTKYFETRFDHMQYQINEIKTELQKTNQRITQVEEVMEKRFEQVGENFKEFRREIDRRFEQVDKQFETVDRHLVEFRDYVDRRFDQMIASINNLAYKIDNKMDKQRDFTLKMFSIAITVSFLGVFGVLLKIFNVI